MNHGFNSNRKAVGSRRVAAFTLIEMLVVIAIMGILAGLIIALAGPAGRSRIKARVRAEMHQFETLIEEYKTDYSFYPPDNTNDCTHPQLVYELMGATNMGTYYALPNATNISIVNYSNLFYRNGIVNSKPLNADEKPRSYFSHIKQQQFTNLVDFGNALYFTLPVDYSSRDVKTKTNTWRYVSTNPTNNGTGHFDLWADINIGGKTERMSNWNQ